MAYVITMVAEFDEYMKDWLYLREGSVFSKPIYEKKEVSQLPEIEISVGGSRSSNGNNNVFAIVLPFTLDKFVEASITIAVDHIRSWDSEM
ncbi:uncharacterized membrane protein [Tanacetum coccineum]|uniref:Uncharacterized membrane protein n=1 Tax=Tanacetum coccineum TaxID=301880 RepID=A0ABQ5I080_9ASTR